MKLEVKGDLVRVTLSKRNLLTLLTKLDHDWSAKSIYLDAEKPGGKKLLLVAESDDEHYANRAAPGVMHPQTEEDIKNVVRT